MLKIGVIGTGNMGRHHVRIYHEMPNVELVAISDKDKNIRERMKREYNIQTYENYEDMLTKVDAVSIAIPTIYHKKVALKCIQQNVDCLIEKPISSNLEDAKEIVDEAKKNKVILAVGHIENFNPVVKELKRIIDDNILGNILIISSKRVGPFVKRVKDIGIILDLATHEIGVIRYLLDVEKGDSVNLFSSWKGLNNEKGDYAMIVMEYKDTISNIEVNWHTPYKSREIIVTGSKAVAKVNYYDQKIQIHDYEWTKSLDMIKKEPLKLELNDFVNSVKNRAKPLVDGSEGLEILKLAVEAESF